MSILVRIAAVAWMGGLAAACGGTAGAGGAGGGASGTQATGTSATTGGPSTGTGTASTGSSGGVTADQACTDRATAQCQQLGACSNGFLLVSRYGDQATCVARQKLVCTNSLAATATGLTPADVEACAKAIPGESCADLENNNPPAACLAVVGTEASGMGCSFGSQCATAFCLVDKTRVCGTCGSEPVVGAPCAGVGDCDKNQVCPAALGQCESPVPLNGACGKTAPCGSGLSCQGATAMMNNGQCKVAGATVGATCDAKHVTAPGCDNTKGLYCTTQGQCAQIAHAATGQPCGDVNGAVVDCSGGGQCVIPGAAVQGTCVAPAADGAPCDTAAGPPCLLPARCVPTSNGTSGTCTVPSGQCP